MGFEPTCPVKDNRISSAARYDHFDNSPIIRSLFYSLEGRMSTIICLSSHISAGAPPSPSLPHVTPPPLRPVRKTSFRSKPTHTAPCFCLNQAYDDVVKRYLGHIVMTALSRHESNDQIADSRQPAADQGVGKLGLHMVQMV